MGDAAQKIEAPQLLFRPPTSSELHLIKASWLYATPNASKIAADRNGDKWITIRIPKQNARDRDGLSLTVVHGWHRAHAALRDQILSDSRTWLIVAALRSQPDEAVAWACMERTTEEGEPVAILWWVHVVGEARGRGVGTALLRTMLDLAKTQRIRVALGQINERARAWWERVTGAESKAPGPEAA